jgi:alcohol dehydrogenase YqhD (iron-dependent ADH family)
MKEPENYGARANLMWAGTIAHNGTCGVGAVEDWASHFMEHEVSAVYDVTHGAGLAVIFPAWLTYMASHNVGKVAQYAHRVWDVPESDDKKAMALEGVARLKSFFHAIGMPVTFKELGIEHPDIDLLVKKLHENKGEYVGSYVRLDAQATREIYELANQ